MTVQHKSHYEAFRALMERCDRRDLSLEGVPMLLGLETLGTPPSFTSDAYGNALADAATELFAQFLAERPKPTVRELRLFVEALAQGFFTPALGPAPAGLEVPPPRPPTTSRRCCCLNRSRRRGPNGWPTCGAARTSGSSTFTTRRAVMRRSTRRRFAFTPNIFRP